MNSVYKYQLETTSIQNVMLPFSAEILSVECQGDNIVLYAFVDTTETKKKIAEVRVYGTGHTVAHGVGFRFIGTAKMHNGNLMWHVFVKEYGDRV